MGKMEKLTLTLVLALLVGAGIITRVSTRRGPQEETMMLRPLYDRILATRDKAPEKSAGGLFIPEEAREQSQELTVQAVGHGRLQPDGTLRPLEVKAGDRILVPKYGPIEIELHGEKFVILTEPEVIGILEAKK